VAVVRTPDRARALFGGDVEIRRADLAERDQLATAFRGVDAVISCAAIVSLGNHAPEHVLHNNVEGIRNVCRAMVDAGVARIVQVSSAEVYLPQPDRHYDEDDPIHAPETRVHRFNAYGVSKAASELALREAAAREGLEVSFGRPHAVHGAHDHGTFSRWFIRLLSLPISIYPTHTYLPSVYVGDLADGMCRMLERPEAATGRAYNLAGPPHLHTLWDFKKAWAEAGGRVPWLTLPIPLPVTVTLSIDRARDELGWSNRPLLDGVREMFEMENG
jgi:nucleoside-diphosphate-sugar epimerase